MGDCETSGYRWRSRRRKSGREKNVSDVLKDLSEKIMTQVTGTQYVEEEYIEVPTETQIDYAESEEE